VDVFDIVFRLAFVQDKETQSKHAETQYNRLDTMENRTQDISRLYWLLNDQYRSLNTTIAGAIDNHQRVQIDYNVHVGEKKTERKIKQIQRMNVELLNFIECHR
jgi:predicted DNA-binding transcriptional regulator YafY